METEKKKRGKWKTGESGNPKGRPPGTGEVTRLRESIAARLLLERVLPSLKPIEQPVALFLPAGDGITGQGRAIVEAVADGTLAPGQGAALLTGLGTLARIKEIDELERRITQLEGVKNNDND